MIKPMTKQLEELKDLLKNVRQKAQGARDESEAAERAAAAGSEVRRNIWQVSTIKYNLDQERRSVDTSHSRVPTLAFRTCPL